MSDPSNDQLPQALGPMPKVAHPCETPEDVAYSVTREANQELFLEHLAAGFSVIEAAEAVGIGRTTGWRWRQDPAFAQRCKEAIKSTVPALEDEAYRRALKGSDKLLMFLLQARDPEKYNPVQKVEHSVTKDLAAAIVGARKRVGG